MAVASLRSYTAYGLHIHSALPLPELTEISSTSSGSQDDLSIVVEIDASVAHRETLADGASMFSNIRGECATLFWPGVGTYQIQNGRSIRIAPEYDADPTSLRVFLIGPVFSVLLHQRGWTTLHGSSVKIDNRGCIFLGGSGWGKSTMCATMLGRGHTAIADDVSLIRYKADQPVVYPAFPRLKLWPDSAHALGEDVTSLSHVRPGYNKRAVSPSKFSLEPVPLHTIYVLERGDRIDIQPLTASAALMTLITHTYSNSVVAQCHRETVFRQYGRIASTVPVKRLIRPWNLSHLNAVVEAVETDMMTPALV